ncbi:MAG: chitobiase/beta-hexosaminidase C-terminal domain-containing protein [Bacteroidales bacterium]|nr:chitobiase/beta-hexosaminidase C-terminal domain-containing protein [Bacteroidales bacterium]
MKKYFSLLCSAAIVALSLSGCSKNDNTPDEAQISGVQKTVNFNAKTPGTKSYFGEKVDGKFPTVWTANNKVAISANLKSYKEATVTPKGTGNTATFNAKLEQPTGATQFIFYALSPASVVVGVSADNSSVTADLPTTQYPTNTSVDEAAHVMAGISSVYTEWPDENTTVDLNFSHIAAYGRFTLENFPETVTISSVDIEAETEIVGRYYFKVTDKTFDTYTASKVLTIKTDNIVANSNPDRNFWFAIRPVDLRGTELKVSVHTDVGTYVKTFSFPNLSDSNVGNFIAGKVATFILDMDGITPASARIFTLVTDYKQLLEDTQVIIVSVDEDQAISTTQKTSNRAAASVTKEENGTVIKDPSPSVQVFILEQGTKSNTVAFNCIENEEPSGQYIGAKGDGNGMLTYNEVDGKVSYNVYLETEVAPAGTINYAVLKSNAENGDYNFMRYNPNNGSPMFNMYMETSPITGKVALYKLQGTGEGEKLVEAQAKNPVIDYDASTQTVTITCPTPDAIIGYTTDGTEPGINETGDGPAGTTQVYNGPFTIDETTTVKAFAAAEHMISSEVVTKVCPVAVPEPTVETIKISETWEASLTDTEGNNAKFVDDGAGVWVVNNTYGRVAANNAVLSSFYSPKFDMSNITGGTISFMHTGNVTGTNYQNLGKAYYRINDGEWTQITLGNPSNNWTWMTAVINASEYAGKTIQFKWEFQGNATKSWEVKQFKITVPSLSSYILDGTITGGTAAYATESEITQNDVSWKVLGNTTMSPWRLGGKSLTAVDRTVYSTTAIANNVNKIVITHGTASNITVNSMTVTVHSSAAGAESGTSDIVATFTPAFVANGDVTINKTGTASWANCYYRIVYNVTVASSETSNRFVQFTKAEFFFE